MFFPVHHLKAWIVHLILSLEFKLSLDYLSKLILSNVSWFFVFCLFVCMFCNFRLTFCSTVYLFNHVCSWLKKFFTFVTASVCFFPDAWTVSAECPDEDNSKTLWQIVHLALVDSSLLASQSLNDGSESHVLRKYF